MANWNNPTCKYLQKKTYSKGLIGYFCRNPESNAIMCTCQNSVRDCPCFEEKTEIHVNKINFEETDAIMNDPVNHPAHYTAGGIECIDAIAAALTSQTDPMSAWLTGQCLKYLWRWPLKNGIEDLKKTQFYLNKLIEHEEKKNGL